MANYLSLMEATDWQLLALLAACLALFALHFVRRGYISVADPAFLLFIVFAFGTAMKVGYFVFLRAEDLTETLFLRRDRMLMGKDADFVVTGMIFITLSVAAYLAGLQHRWAWSGFGNRLRGVNLNGGLLQAVALIAVVATVAALAFFLVRVNAFETGELFAKRFNELEGGSTTRFFVLDYWIFKAISSIKYLFYALLILWIYRSERGSPALYLLLVATFALSVLVPAVFGNRANAFVMCLDLTILLFVAISWRRTVLFVVFLAVAGALMVVTTLDRYSGQLSQVEMQVSAQKRKVEEIKAAEIEEERIQARKRKELSPEDQAEAARLKAAEEAAKALEAARVESSLWFTNFVGPERARQIEIYVSGRYFLDLFRTSHIVDEIPGTLPYLYGNSFIGWPFVVVPRSLWPDKPVSVETAPMLAKSIFLEPQNNVPPGLVGEAYWNFGWWLGLLVIGAVGAMTGAIYNTFRLHRHNPIIQVAFVIAVTRLTIIMFNTSFGEAVLKTLIDLVPVLILILLAARFPIGKGALNAGIEAGSPARG